MCHTCLTCTQEAMAKLQHSSAPRSGFRRSKRPMFGTTQVLLAIQQPGRGAQYAVYRPHTGLSAIEMDADELNSKYERQEAGSAEAAWTAMFDTSQTRCMHGEGCSNGSSCQVGRRLQRVTLLTGSVVRVWGALEMVLERNALALPRAERAMRVVRVALDDGRSLIGVLYFRDFHLADSRYMYMFVGAQLTLEVYRCALPSCIVA